MSTHPGSVVVARVDRTRQSLLSSFGDVIAGVPRMVGAVPPTVQVLIGIVSAQVGAAFAKQLFTVVGPSGVAAMRLVFGGAIMLLLWRPSLRISRTDRPVVIGFGLVLATMNVLLYLSLMRLPLGIAVTVEFLGPLALALLGSRRLLDALWAVLAACGVAMLAEPGGDVDLVGLLLALGAGVCWAGYILLSASLGRRSSDGTGLALAVAFAALFAVPIGVADAGAALWSLPTLLIGLGVGLMSSVVPFSLELEALRRIPPRVFAVLMSLEPAVAALAGLLLLGEELKPMQWTAVCCVVVASAGATWIARSDV